MRVRMTRARTVSGVDSPTPPPCPSPSCPPSPLRTTLQDNPVVDDMKATLDYDLSTCLANPRWTDGFQLFDNIVYEPGLAVIFDVR